MYLSIAHGLMRSLFAFLGAIHLLTDGALAKYVEGRLKTSEVSWHGVSQVSGHVVIIFASIRHRIGHLWHVFVSYLAAVATNMTSNLIENMVSRHCCCISTI